MISDDGLLGALWNMHWEEFGNFIPVLLQNACHLFMAVKSFRAYLGKNEKQA
jgi:hypothetical protein